jgi:addiction module HigA family antidote
MTNSPSKHIGGNFDDFLVEEAMLEEVAATALERISVHNPPHPGETLRDDVLPAPGLAVTAAAEQLGVTRAALSRVLNGSAGTSPEMALRIEGWLGVDRGGRADLRIAKQASFDLWQAHAHGAPHVERAYDLEAV